MLDIHYIRQNVTRVKQAVRAKRATVDVDELLQLDEQRRQFQTEVDGLAQQRKALARQGRSPDKAQMLQGKELKERLGTTQKQLQAIEAHYQELLERVPNIPTDDTPLGQEESDNVELRAWGERPALAFPAREHWQLGLTLGVIDNERAAKVAGSRFTYLKGELVWLEMALWQFTMTMVTNTDILQGIIDQHNLSISNKPFTPVLPPALIKPEAMQKMARLEPREERYHIASDNLYLIGSAEHTLGAMHSDEMIAIDDLPLRYLGFSPAFRREAGSYGKDVHGILRMHQFDKLEFESFSQPEKGLEEHAFLVAIQEHLLQTLGLPYRVMLVCTGQMGGPDARQIDIETWLPGQGRFRETHTADYMTDYQARRLHIKVRRGESSPDFVHMNDATALAMGRTMVAIMENYQQADGTITLPRVLHPYLPFTVIPAQ